MTSLIEKNIKYMQSNKHVISFDIIDLSYKSEKVSIKLKFDSNNIFLYLIVTNKDIFFTDYGIINVLKKEYVLHPSFSHLNKNEAIETCLKETEILKNEDNHLVLKCNENNIVEQFNKFVNCINIFFDMFIKAEDFVKLNT
jgi:hypothetical protein